MDTHVDSPSPIDSKRVSAGNYSHDDFYFFLFITVHLSVIVRKFNTLGNISILLMMFSCFKKFVTLKNHVM